MKIQKEYIPQSIMRSAPKRKGVLKNKDGSVSTHLMMRGTVDGNWITFPSLFQNEDGTWVDMSQEKDISIIYNEAKKRGEVINWGDDEESAIEYADKGSWKDIEPQTVVGTKEYTPQTVSENDEYVPQTVKKRKEYIPQTQLNKK